MATYTEALQQLETAKKAAEQWDSVFFLPISVAKSYANDALVDINLTDTLGHNKFVPRETKRDDNTCYWLPSSYIRNDHKFCQSEINTLLVIACKDVGFKV